VFIHQLRSNARTPVGRRLRRMTAVALAVLVTTVGMQVASASPALAAWFVEGVYPSVFECNNIGQGGVIRGRWISYRCEPEFGGNPNNYRLWVETSSTPPPASPPAGSVSFYRLSSPTTGDHFSTIDVNEYLSAQTCCGYQPEGTRSYIAAGPGSGLVPFYRLWSPTTGDHFHTADPNEYLSAQTCCGYLREGIRGYVYPASSTRGVPLYRVWNPTTGDHFHTTSWVEVQGAQQLGFLYEGVRARAFG
jgi:hypothetical protein